MTMEGHYKSVTFMTPIVREGGLGLYKILMTSKYNTLIAIVLWNYMQLFYVLVDFYWFVMGLLICKYEPSQTRSQWIVSDIWWTSCLCYFLNVVNPWTVDCIGCQDNSVFSSERKRLDNKILKLTQPLNITIYSCTCKNSTYVNARQLVYS